MVDKLAHLFGGAIRSLVFGGDPGLAGLLHDLLADEMGALVQLINGQEPACLVSAFSLSSANSDSKVFMFPYLFLLDFALFRP